MTSKTVSRPLRSFLVCALLAATPLSVRAEPGIAAGDWTLGEDMEVRQAALAALGSHRGTVVAVETDTGRVLSMVNQKLALSNGYIPCSTIKLFAGVAALAEELIAPGEKVYFRGGWYMTMVEGLAISNNVLFDHLGERLGFGRFEHYARLFGLGEKAGWRIPGEQLGEFPSAEHPAGVGRMTSFGDGIAVTPLQLAAFVSALANGGDLYYLQHPSNQAEADAFEPILKRRLPILGPVAEIKEGMAEAVRRGTGRQARIPGAPLWGKTGTCSYGYGRARTKMGWFASYGNLPDGRSIAVVVMLKGTPNAYGPMAADVAGKVYKGLLAPVRQSRLLENSSDCACD